MNVRTMTKDDWPQVASIYMEGIMTGRATFQTEVPSYDEWDRGHLEVGRIVQGDWLSPADRGDPAIGRSRNLDHPGGCTRGKSHQYDSVASGRVSGGWLSGGARQGCGWRLA